MGSSSPRVTVVIPVWGSYVTLLPEAVGSIRDAAVSPRVIVVDNANDPPVAPPEGCELVRSDERLSRGSARNLGLSRVTTDYVVFLDADDLLLPGSLAHLIAGLDGRPDVQAVVGGIVESDGSPHRTPRVLSRRLARASRLFAWINAAWSLTPIQGCAVLRTATVRDSGGYPDASSGEDWVVGASLVFRGKVVFDDEPALVYRLRADSPGASDSTPNAVLLQNAARVRERLARDEAIAAGRVALAALAAAQAVAVFAVRPLARGVRALVERPARSPGSLAGGSIPVVRVIARLNIGGPAIQAITLTKRLESLGYGTSLVRGREGEREGRMDDLAAEVGVKPMFVPALRREPGLHDLLAVARLVRIMRAKRPRIVHTHAAKAGTLGRVAALIAFPSRRKRPVLVHTFHGQSLTGYFSPRASAVYTTIERILARRTDRLIAVSEEVRDELVALGVAKPEKFEVIALGFDLDRFSEDAETRARERATIREEFAIPPSATLITLIARLVPIKRVDRFLQSALNLLDLDNAHFLVVGDGELRDVLRSSPEARALGDRLIWAGFRRDIPAVCAASDLVVLTSDNEGTPVSLIEAGAAGVPTVSTRVGGAAKVIRDGETGALVACDDGKELADTVRRLAENAKLRARMGEAAHAHVRETFSIERLVADIDKLYLSLLESRPGTVAR